MIEHEKIKNAYLRLHNVWKVGAELGISGQRVHSILSKNGDANKMNYFTEEDKVFLLEHYSEYREKQKLDELASILGRTKQFICRKAKELGLTDSKHRPNCTEETKSRLRIIRKDYYKTHPHPRGYLGHTHSAKTRKKLSEASQKSWANPDSGHHSEKRKQSLSDAMMYNRITGKIRSKSNRKMIVTEIGGKLCEFKSSWEFEIAKKLETLKQKGYIKDWGYEPEHFIFQDCNSYIRSYCPDFKVTLNEKEFYIEVKGWKIPIGMKRMQMFLERYKDKQLYLIDEHEYRKIISDADYLRRYTEQIERI